MVNSAALHRQAYIWSWRVRYWLLDTRVGSVVAVASLLACAVAATMLARLGWQMATDRTVPQHAEITLAAYLIIMLVSAIISWALTPKPKEPKPQSAEAPTVEDGQDIRMIFGTVWIDDPIVVAWKTMGTDKIRRSGKK